jgi:protein-disulfide isomerase
MRHVENVIFLTRSWHAARVTRDDEVRQMLQRAGRRRPDAAPNRARARRLTLEERYGALESVADLPAVINRWRRNIPAGGTLTEPVRPDRDHLRGDPAAAVVVVEYGDYQCVECAEAHDLYARLQEWIDSGRVCEVFRHFPLVDPHHLALRAAQAAEAAAAQGRFWEMHDALMGHGVETAYDGSPYVVLKTPQSDDKLERMARRAGLDAERFRADLDGDAGSARILADFRSGLASGVSGTPTFYLNGTRAEIAGIEDLYDAISGLVS